ncbi:hypothetical protein KI659_11865 [Litoribacter alkaliphilus]|uniref:Uncharacterized protein n=1 Tax=Litoribacter ruber TaxID=702568 RepID=A0AAP2G543_9BACT|nr:DUF6600 domain-containing protein [Litoribacter alkaliphilus]MBS9524706.1 hypothetical protein [Litoribacter alkaliphilus]
MRNPFQYFRSYRQALRVFAVLAFISIGIHKPVHAQMQGAVSFQVFYDELMPYGTWVNDPQYGFVWVPHVHANFHPYATNGHWVMTSYGNTWVSDFDWGWAPFHYGRWFYSNRYGWSWVPGYEWGPAWVDWRTGGGYYGWAPLAPGVHINVVVNLPYHHYVFVPHNRLIHRRVHRYFVPRARVVNIYQQTTIINNTVVVNQRSYVGGPHRRDLERVSRRSIPVYQVSNSGRPGRSAVARGSVAMYRPEVNRNTATQARPSRAVNSSEFTRGARPNRTAPVRSSAVQQRANSGVQRNSSGNVKSEATAAPSRVSAQPAQRGQVQQRPAQTQTRQAAPRQQQQVRSSAPNVNSTRQQAPANRSSNVQSRPSNRNSGSGSAVRSNAPRQSNRSSGGTVSSSSSSRSSNGTVSRSSSSRSSGGGTVSRSSSNSRGNSRRGGN